MQNDVIAAVATATGAAGVAVIRLSGEGALSIAAKMFSPAGKTPVKEFTPYKMYPGEFDGGNFRDYGLTVYFKAPHSYTGEDVVEFHTHGGVAIAQGVLRRAIELGARLATRGEYTRRAFINGKLSLSSAEGLIGMIYSESDSEVRAGYSLYRECLKEKIKKTEDALTTALAAIDADIDFPEEDLDAVSREETKKSVLLAASELNALLATYRTGRKLKNGVKVAIAGRPNVGKSSLLNRLLGFDKAIVSDEAGTTRDVVEGELEINGVRFLLSDTAGLRESKGVEALGVEMAKKTLLSSDLILFVADEGDVKKEDEEIFSSLTGVVVAALNKCDAYAEGVPLPAFLKNVKTIRVSAKTGEGAEELKTLLYDTAFSENVDVSGEFLTEERHYFAIKRAAEKLGDALAAIDTQPMEIVAVDVTAALSALGEISGKTATEAVVDEIFSRFCVGK